MKSVISELRAAIDLDSIVAKRKYEPSVKS